VSIERDAPVNDLINAAACIDLNAPTLPAHEVVRRFTTRWRVWCKFCRRWHYHGPGEGHRDDMLGFTTASAVAAC
jgi:hypothetical protein